MDGTDGLQELDARTAPLPQIEVREEARRGEILAAPMVEAPRLDGARQVARSAPAGTLDGTVWSGDRTDIMAAFAKAQAAFEPIKKNRVVRVKAKSGATYDFAYATLDAILNAVRKPLGANGLFVSQSIAGNEIVTMIGHSSGQWFGSRLDMRINQFAGPQDRGSAITYGRRYSLMALLGIAAEGEDDDANAAEGNEIIERDGEPVGAERKPKEEYWGGPLTKTELGQKLRAFNGDLYSCEDLDQLTGLLAHKETRAILAQCQRDLPHWWETQKGADGLGLKDRIESVKRELQGGTA